MAPRTMLAVTLLAQAWGFEVEPALPRREAADATAVSPGPTQAAEGETDARPAQADRTAVFVQLLTKSKPRMPSTLD